MRRPTSFAGWVFTIAGLYGLAIMLPCYALADRVLPGASPAALAVYYGFVGVVVGFQVLFLVIGGDPPRFRAAMIPAMIDKIAFAIPVLAHAADPGVRPFLLFTAVDIVLLTLFAIAYRRTPERGG